MLEMGTSGLMSGEGNPSAASRPPLKLAWAVTVIVLLYFYLHYVLALFPWTRAFANVLLSLALDPLRSMGLGLIGQIPNFAFLVILIVITRYALKLLRLFSDGVAGGVVTIKGFDPDWAWPTYRLVRLLAIAFATAAKARWNRPTRASRRKAWAHSCMST